MKTHKKKRFFALLLSLFVAVSLLGGTGVTAFADTGDETNSCTFTWKNSDNEIYYGTISGSTLSWVDSDGDATTVNANVIRWINGIRLNIKESGTLTLRADLQARILVNGSSDVIVDLNGYTLTPTNDASFNYVTYVDDGCTLTLTDNSEEGGGKIDGNSNSGNNYGVYCSKGSTLVISQCTIENCSRAGVYMVGNSKVTIDDGTTFKDNKSTNGACIYAGGSNNKITINGGEFSNNTASYNGGAICVTGSDNVLLIRGGTFKSNYAKYGGAIASNNGATVEMTGGTITKNTAIGGGAVCTIGTSEFTLEGGTISDNTAGSGGAVMVAAGSTFEMTGGTIAGNGTSSNYYRNYDEGEDDQNGFGGGVFVQYKGDATTTVELSGGEISNNTAEEGGDDIYVYFVSGFSGDTNFSAALSSLISDSTYYGNSGELIDGWYSDDYGDRYSPSCSAEAVESVTLSSESVGFVAAYGVDHDYDDSVASSNGSTVTYTCTECGNAYSVDISSDDTGSVTVAADISKNAPETSAAVSSKANLVAATLTQKEAAYLNNGANVTYTLAVAADGDDGANISDNDKSLAEALASSLGIKTDLYLDITLSYTITNSDGDVLVESGAVTDTKSAVYTITIAIPESLVDADSSVTRTYYVIRVHDGAAEQLEVTNNNDGTISFESSLFSTYAIAYAETEEETTTSSGDEATTGDTGNIALWGIIAVIALLGIGVVVVRRKFD